MRSIPYAFEVKADAKNMKSATIAVVENEECHLSSRSDCVAEEIQSVPVCSLRASDKKSRIQAFELTAPSESAICSRILCRHDLPHPQLHIPIGEPEI